MVFFRSGLVPAHGYRTFRTGVHIQLPHGTAGVLVSKSGLYTKCGISSTGLIDEGFTGEIKVCLINNSEDGYEVQAGDKISQLVIIPVCYGDVVRVDELDGGTERGDNGFGSSGKR